MDIYKPIYPKTVLDFKKAAFEIKELSGRLLTYSIGVSVGIRFNNGVLIASETLAARNGMLLSTTWKKIFSVCDHIYCCGSGLARDIETAIRFTEVKLLPLTRSSNPIILPTSTVRHVMKQMMNECSFRTEFIVIGVDRTGVNLSTIYGDGTSETGMFNSLGNARYPAMAMLESRWSLDINEEDAVQLAVDALSANYLSIAPYGHSIEICIIHKDYSVKRINEKIRPIAERQLIRLRPEKTAAKNTDWLQDLVVTSENVILLEPPLMRTRSPTPDMPEPFELPISSHALRKTIARTQLHDAPPEKKRRLSEMEE